MQSEEWFSAQDEDKDTQQTLQKIDELIAGFEEEEDDIELDLSDKIDGYYVEYDAEWHGDVTYVSKVPYDKDGVYWTRRLWYRKKDKDISLFRPNDEKYKLRQAKGKVKSEPYTFKLEIENGRVLDLRLVKLKNLDKTLVKLLLGIHDKQISKR